MCSNRNRGPALRTPLCKSQLSHATSLFATRWPDFRAMPKAKKRKPPIAQTSNTTLSTNAQVCRKTINQFHLLLKRRSQLLDVQDPTPIQVQDLANIGEEIARLGGLEKYQQMSVNGQKDERGGGSEKIFISWMKELGLHHTHKEGKQLRYAIYTCLRAALADMKAGFLKLAHLNQTTTSHVPPGSIVHRLTCMPDILISWSKTS